MQRVVQSDSDSGSCQRQLHGLMEHNTTINHQGGAFPEPNCPENAFNSKTKCETNNLKNAPKRKPEKVYALLPWKLKLGFINRVLVAVIFEASKCL